MSSNFRVRSAVSVLCLAAWLPVAARAVPDPQVQAVAEAAAKAIAAELAGACPVVDPGDAKAFEACRQRMFRSAALRQALPDFVLWGRQRDPNMALKDSRLTQFGPDVFSSMYVPLFMFDGRYAVSYVASEDSYLIRLPTAFRNRLAPGEYPYPFWHDAEKWAMYEKANEILLYWDAAKARIRVAQFTAFGAGPSLQPATHVEPPAFDGRWVWTDANGQMQPKVSVFDGVFRRDNPYLQPLDTAYQQFALRLRDAQCNQCHVPNNPDGMKKLVLLQSPMHTAAEIKRVLQSVREDRMPRDEVGIEQPLDAPTKAALLKEGTAFDRVLDAAKLWEAVQVNAAAAAPKPLSPRDN
jgi:hypothetical protein